MNALDPEEYFGVVPAGAHRSINRLQSSVDTSRIRVRAGMGRLEAQDHGGQPQCLSERQEPAEREKHMAAFGFGKAASIHPSRQGGKLGLADVPAFAKSPEHETDAAGQLLVLISGAATERTVHWDYQVFKSERPMTADAGAVSWVLGSAAAEAHYRLAVAYRG